MPVQEISKTNSDNLISRQDLINLLEQAVSSGNFSFIQSVSQAWLQKYPHDIPFQLFQLRSSIHDQDKNNSNKLLTNICTRDPENIRAWELLLKNTSQEDLVTKIFIQTVLYALGNNYPDKDILDWGKELKEIIQSFDFSEISKKYSKWPKSLDIVNSTPLIAIYHLKSLNQNNAKEEFNKFAEQFHQKWPECIAISLLLADSMLETGKEDEAVSLLHTCSINDPGADIVRKMWGNNHDFSTMWPANLEMRLSLPIPQQLSLRMNWKQLPSGHTEQISLEKQSNIKIKSIIEKITPPFFREKTVDKIFHNKEADPFDGYGEKDLNEVFQKSGSFLSKESNGKKPVQVFISIKQRLISKYGERSFFVMSTELKKLVDTVKLKSGWDAMIFYPDDENCTRLLDLDPITDIDPWKIKLSIVDLDKTLSSKGQMIGCLLIIGGGDIVPFHALPNPTDDKDKEVLSDNPYSTLDANYFVPEWPVGRLPGEKTNDPGLLLKQIRQIAVINKNKFRNTNWWNLIFELFNNNRNLQGVLNIIGKKKVNYGYTASIWRRSSLASFRPIGTGNHLRVTPPFDSSNLDLDLLKKSKFAYFNLHGLPDTPEWYGQRDISESEPDPDFPIALSAGQIKTTDVVPSVVFSEACYGGFTDNKDCDESLALTFKDAGSDVFIGSTCISYGSINTPLVGADLLAFIFWKYLLDGFSSGEAFMRAKVNFAQVMMQRQGYLDGEDQKILLSFVHYGDPLSSIKPGKSGAKSIPRVTELIKVKTITDHENVETKDNRLSGDVINKIKNDLKSYLPGLDLAEIKIHPHHQTNTAADTEFGKGNFSSRSMAGHMKITYHQPMTYKETNYDQYTRVTVDRSGKMIKLVTSR